MPIDVLNMPPKDVNTRCACLGTHSTAFAGLAEATYTSACHALLYAQKRMHCLQFGRSLDVHPYSWTLFPA